MSNNNIQRVLIYGLSSNNLLIPFPIEQNGGNVNITTDARRFGYLGDNVFEETWQNTPRQGAFFGNDDTILSAATRNAAVNSSTLNNFNHRGIHIVTNITAIATSSLTLTLQGLDNISGNFYDIGSSSALNSVGTFVFACYPGLTPGADTLNNILPRNYRIAVAVGDGTDVTYSISQNKVL